MKKIILTGVVAALSIVGVNSAFASASSSTTDIYAARGGLTVQSPSLTQECNANTGHCGAFNNDESITVIAKNLGSGTASGAFRLNEPLAVLNASTAELMDQTDTCDAEYKNKETLISESHSSGNIIICY